MRVGICSGYFALGISHPGHLDLLNGVLKDYCEIVEVIVNNDSQTENKYGFVPLDALRRCVIIESINPKFETWVSIDKDESVAKTIEYIYESYKKSPSEFADNPSFTFYNSGDRNPESANASELEVCERLGIEIKYLDMPKRGSSSDLIKKIKQQGVDELYTKYSNPSEGYQRRNLKPPSNNISDYIFERSPLERYLKPGDIGYI